MNDGNFFINVDNGKVLICDNDNVCEDGKDTGIIGKVGYIAPEVILKKNMPNQLSDRFSMSIIIFRLFCLSHPLEGRNITKSPGIDYDFMKQLYGSQAVFVMDPNDDSNRPILDDKKNIDMFWPVLPEYMKNIFINSFSKEAIENPSRRPSELDWIKALTRFRSDIVKCSCGNEVFLSDGEFTECEKCRKKIQVNNRLDVNEYKIPLLDGSRVYRCQTGTCNVDKALDPVLGVISNLNNPNLLGICNMTDKYIDAMTPSGKERKVAPKEVVPVKEGISLTIYDRKCKITK